LLRISIILCLACLSVGRTFGQHYSIEGPLFINLCESQFATYTIDSNQQLTNTIWSIDPLGGASIYTNSVTTALVGFYAPGTYILTATSFNLNQQLFSDSLIIQVVNGTTTPIGVEGCYVIDSLSKCYQVCAGSTSTLYYDFQYEVNITGAETYSFVDGSGGNGNIIEVTWGSAGSGSVTAFTGPCPTSICFEILPLPIADFQTTPAFSQETLTVCKFQEILFENLSFNGLSYTWHFGDGTTSTGFDAIHSYSSEGFYTVTLDAESICMCGDSKEIIVEVLPAPAPTLDCVNTVCPETHQRYTATTNGCTQYNWSISSNGTIVNGGEATDDFIEIIWHDGPEGLINLSVSGCATTYCSYTNTFHIPILTPDGPVSGDAQVCTGGIVTYSAPYFPGTQYFWQISSAGNIMGGQGTNAIAVKWDDVNVVTTSDVEVYYGNCFLGCSGQDVLSVSITPEIKLNGDTHVCQDADATINATAGFITPLPANVQWHIEDEDGQTVSTVFGPSSSFTHTFSYPPGEYFWVAKSSSSAYCTELVRQKISVTAIPDTPLGIEGDVEICPGQPFGYTIVEAGNFATYWTITDGASISHDHGQSIQHVFGTTQPYIVEAVHTDLQYPECASGSVSITLSPATNLVISGSQDVCFSSIEAYTIPYINGSDYQWEIIPADFGEVRRSDLNHVEIFWAQSGSATLRLSTCGTIIDMAITIHPLPVFNVIGPLAACANETVSMSTDQPLLDHIWKNETGSVLSTANNVLLFPGTYSIEVTDALGCSSTETFTITSYPAPSVYVTSPGDNNYCNTVPAGVDLVANTDGDGYVFEWFKDDVSTGVTDATYTLTQFGTYYVTVVNQYGCTASSPKITISDCCGCSGGGGGLPGGGCTYQIFNFDVHSTGPECPIRNYTPQEPNLIPGQSTWFIWSISEGILGVENVDVLDHTYLQAGYYHLLLLGHLAGYPYDLTDCGHIESFTDTIRAVADFKSTGTCVNAQIDFEDLTTFIPGETISSWHWNFGDPSSGPLNESADQDPLHEFASAGDYSVTLTVTMASGCITTKTSSVHISAGPVLSPVYDPVYCEDEAYRLFLPGNVFDVLWDFGDVGSGILNMASSEEVFHTYSLPGLYSTTVSAADIYGCRSQGTIPVDIRANMLSGNISVIPSNTICFGDTVTLIAPAGGVNWNWNTGELNSQIEVVSTDNYSVLIEDGFHCTYSPPPQFITVLAKPNVFIQGHEMLSLGEFGPWHDTLHLCEGTEFQLQAFFEGSLAIHWSTGSIYTEIEFTDEGGNLPGAGWHEYFVTGFAQATGCRSDTAFYVVEIYSLPNTPIITLSSGSGCSFDVNTLQVTNPQAGILYHWSDGQIGTTITTSVDGAYHVTAVNQNGCSAESNVVLINPSAPVDQIPGGCHIACDPLSVCLPPIDDVTSWNIYQDGVLYQSGTFWPSNYLITTDGSYTIEVTTSNGCTATSDPLDISLYPGVGSITVLTYMDVDGDGLITAADLLLSGIPIIIESSDGLQHGETFTEADGGFVFENYPASSYTAYFNLALLSSQWKVIIDSVNAQIVTCDDSIVVSLLLMENCTVAGPDQTIESCPGEIVMYGDSIWSDTGVYAIHLLSELGCDSTFSVNVVISDTIEISTTVWVDVDQNGVLSPADTVIEGITIVIDEGINHAPFIGLTDSNGNVVEEFHPGHYFVSVDSTILPQGLSLLFGLAFVPDTFCGAVHFDFLLAPSCSDVFLIQQEELCAGDSVLIQGQSITQAGVYSFLLSQPGSGCDTTLDVYVTVLPELIISGVTDWDCINLGSIELTVQGSWPFQYFWDPILQGDSIVTTLDDGSYFVNVVDANGCSANETFNIQSTPSLSFSLPPHFDIHPGDSVEVIVTGDVNENGLHFQWIPNTFLSCDTCSATWAFPDSSTLLIVHITDADSCVYDLETYISVTLDSNNFDRIFVPNVFSPNDDGFNDRWTIFSRLDNTWVNSLVLFDRWGKMLFAKDEFLLKDFEGWDGISYGKDLNPGVYAYVADLTLGDGTKTRVKGDVTLIR